MGAEALSDTELVAILLRTGSSSTGENALALASRLLARLKGLGVSDDQSPVTGLKQASIEELTAVKGIGNAKAAQLKAALELGQRGQLKAVERTALTSPREAGAYMVRLLQGKAREHFYVVLLDAKNHVLATELISVGGLSVSLAHPREVFKAAIRRSAAAVILAHNHPSGDPEPSPEDIRLTTRLVEAGELLGIEVLDHLIVGRTRYLSLRERGVAWKS
jgi:DNA repair protein RadC